MFESVEAGGDGAYVIWESSRPTVVIGRGNREEEWVHVDACGRDGVDILRRCSGGGAVVLGPGCVNYAVAVAAVSHPRLVDVAASFEAILQHFVDAFGPAGLLVMGRTDLVADGRKVSGNAQRRGRRALLHHGTVLYDFDPRLAVDYLREPRRQPSYRAGRDHESFLGNVPGSRQSTVSCVRRACESVVRWSTA